MKQIIKKKRENYFPVSWIRGVVMPLLILLVIASCTEEVPGGNSSSKKGQSTVRFVISDQSYSDNQSITRSFGGMKPETAVIPLSDDFFMMATLEASPATITRTGTALANGRKVRIVAYKVEGSDPETLTYQSTETYTVINDQLTADHTEGLHVPSGNNYRFVAYSYKTQDAALYDSSGYAAPPEPDTNGLIENIDPRKDLMWGITSALINNADEKIDIEMEHAFSQIKIVVSTVQMLGTPHPAIASISDATISEYSNGNLTVKTGDVAAGTTVNSSSLLNLWTPTLYNDTMTSNSVIVVPQKSANSILNVSFSITLGAATSLPITSTLAAVLKRNCSYTLTANLIRRIHAASNIYWNGSALTFDTDYVPEQQQKGYHGVLFKYGSLVGISPTDNFNSTTRIYYNINGTNWTSSTVEEAVNNSSLGWISDTSYDNIPKMIVPSGAGTPYRGRNDNFVNRSGINYNTQTGDICEAINPRYRLPSADEFGKTGSSHTWNEPPAYTANAWKKGTSFVITEVSNPNNSQLPSFSTFFSEDGMTDVFTKFPDAGFASITDVKFPATITLGNGNSPGGSTSLPFGDSGYYWSGSGGNLIGNFLLYFSSKELLPGGQMTITSEQMATPIRCVQKFTY